MGTTIGPIVVALILFDLPPKSGAELNEMISNGAISLSTITKCFDLSVGGLFLAAAALFFFSKKLPQGKDDSEFLKAPKALSALLIMTLLLAACFYFIFDQYRGVPNDEVILNYTILSLVVVVGTLLDYLHLHLAAKIKDSWGAMQYPQLVLGMLAIFTYVGVEVEPFNRTLENF